jgi:signal transduction histidine kinase/CheY-like chemotaxis protein
VTAPIFSLAIQSEHHIVTARRKTRQIAELLGFDVQDQIRIATATSEIARNALMYAGGGKSELSVQTADRRQSFEVKISDNGPGIADLNRVLNGAYRSSTGMGLGIIGARRLMDEFEITSSAGAGTTVRMRKVLPAKAPLLDVPSVREISHQLLRLAPESLHEELQLQNQELLVTLDELNRRQEDLTRVNRELEDTNRGVLALYSELDEKAVHLRRADEMKSQFLSHMSHEFRTPLNSILALTRLLLSHADGELTKEQEKQIVFVRSSAQDLFELVNDLLDLAKVEAGRIDVRVTDFEVADLFAALRGMFRPLVRNDVELQFEEPDQVPRLKTDESKVSQILRNFISNALKFTEIGEVRVSAHLDAGGRSVVFSVRDTGIGISAPDQEIIFHEFTQIPNALQKHVRGTGLGLPLSRKLAELLGGSIQVASEPGRGSEFRAIIPLRYEQHPVDTSTEQESILIIDDEEISRYVLKQYVKESYTLLEASDGRQGVERAKRDHPRLIFLDLMMPDVNGYAVLDSLKEDAATRNIPVIVYTSKVLDKHERKRILDKAASILMKDALSTEIVADSMRQALAGAERKDSQMGVL